MKSNTANHDATTTQRDWHDLKPGDVIFFANGWFEVFDAYASSRDTVTVKLHIPANRRVAAHIETYRVRTGASHATCRL